MRSWPGNLAVGLSHTIKVAAAPAFEGSTRDLRRQNARHFDPSHVIRQIWGWRAVRDSDENYVYAIALP